MPIPLGPQSPAQPAQSQPSQPTQQPDAWDAAIQSVLPASPTSPAPATQAQPSISALDPSKNGGVLGMSVIGALSGAEKAHNAASPSVPQRQPDAWDAAIHSVLGGNTGAVSAGTPVEHVRYSAPGQGIQEFEKGSPEEQQFLGRFPQAQGIPVPAGTGGKVAPSYTALKDTPYQQAEAANVAESNRKGMDALKVAATTVAGIMAPELLPEIEGGGVLTALAKIGARAAASGGAAGATALATGDTPTEAAETGAGFAGGEVLGGVFGKLVDLAKAKIMTPEVLDQIKNLTSKIGGEIPSSSQAFGENLFNKVKAAKTAVGNTYDAALDKVVSRVQGVPVGSAELAELDKTGQQLIGENFSVPKGREDVAGLTAPETRVVDLIKSATDTSKPALTVQDARLLRQRLLSAAESDSLTASQQGAAKKFGGMLNDTVKSALNNISPDLANEFADVNARYGQYMDTLNNGLLSNLFEKNPKTGVLQLKRDASEIGSYLWRQASPETAAEVKTLVGPENFATVQQGIMKHFWDETFDAVNAGQDGGIVLNRLWNKAGVGAQTAYFGPLRNEIDGLVKDVTNKPGVLRKVLGKIYLGHAGPLGVLVSPEILADVTKSAGGIKLVRNLVNAQNPQAASVALKALMGVMKFNEDENEEAVPSPIAANAPEGATHVGRDPQTGAIVGHMVAGQWVPLSA
jgi:hypothetical protein